MVHEAKEDILTVSSLEDLDRLEERIDTTEKYFRSLSVGHDDIESFTQAKVDVSYETILKLLNRRKKLIPCRGGEFPHAYLLAGQPGAGKTVLSSYFAKLQKDLRESPRF